MTTYYSNITVHGPSQEEIIKYIKAAGRRAYVSPTVNGFTVIYDHKCDEEMDPRLTAEVASGLSKAFLCNALAVINRHDYILIYQLYRDGQIVDEYFSEHYLFDFDAITSYQVAGDVNAICSAFGKEEKSQRIALILGSDYESEHERHGELARELGLPEFAVSLGFNAIHAGELPDGVEPHEIKCINC